MPCQSKLAVQWLHTPDHVQQKPGTTVKLNKELLRIIRVKDKSTLFSLQQIQDVFIFILLSLYASGSIRNYSSCELSSCSRRVGQRFFPEYFKCSQVKVISDNSLASITLKTPTFSLFLPSLCFSENTKNTSTLAKGETENPQAQIMVNTNKRWMTNNINLLNSRMIPVRVFNIDGWCW